MLIYYYLYSLIILFYSSLYIYVSKYKHFLLILLSLESIILSLYILIFIYFVQFFYEYFLLILFLTIRVCERALGLSLLVLIVRVHGGDIILIFDNLW